MAVIIGNASIDEHGRISGGKDGDQTGREVCTRNWYKKPWDTFIICKDKDLAKKAADYMKAICGDDSFGYNQNRRTTGYYNIVKAGSVQAAAPGAFDCSSLVASCYNLAGLNINVNCTTRNLEEALLRTGKFASYKDNAHVNTSDYAEPGAIYLSTGHHVAMALSYGSKAGSTTVKPTPAPHPTSNRPNYKVGNVYTLQVEMRVRTGAGTGNPAKGHNQLTVDGQKHDIDRDGALDKNTKVSCLALKKIGNDIWMRTPSGWLAAYYQGNVYIA